MFEAGSPPCPWRAEASKSSDNAERCRIAGNKVFKKKEFEKAIEYYNRSLCFAPPNSRDIPMAYGNRSAVYFEMGKYTLAIENIKLARESGFPTDKIAQLVGREERCKKLIETSGPDTNAAAESFFKLSHPPNAKIPFIAGCLELRKCEKDGRGIYTTEDLKTGDIIAIEDPAFTWLSESATLPACLHCAKTNNGSLIPCDHCTTVMYCSDVCQQKAASVHFNDGFNKIHSDVTGSTLKMLLEAFRIAGGMDEALELLKDSEGKTIFDFDFSNPDDPFYDKNMLIAVSGLFKNIVSENLMEFKPEQLLDIPPINEKPRTPKERKQLLEFIISQNKICCSNLVQHRDSHPGIFPFKSLINHSCNPNLRFQRFNEKIFSMVARPIKAGEQVLCFYSVNAATATKAERHENLKMFQFKCECEACTDDWPKPFPRKDSLFVKPDFVEFEPAEAIEQFKKNCKYIDDNAENIPCDEVLLLTAHNWLLTECIAGRRLPSD